jgi:hypothetical protein
MLERAIRGQRWVSTAAEQPGTPGLDPSTGNGKEIKAISEDSGVGSQLLKPNKYIWGTGFLRAGVYAGRILKGAPPADRAGPPAARAGDQPHDREGARPRNAAGAAHAPDVSDADSVVRRRCSTTVLPRKRTSAGYAPMSQMCPRTDMGASFNTARDCTERDGTAETELQNRCSTWPKSWIRVLRPLAGQLRHGLLTQTHAGKPAIRRSQRNDLTACGRFHTI